MASHPITYTETPDPLHSSFLFPRPFESNPTNQHQPAAYPPDPHLPSPTLSTNTLPRGDASSMPESLDLDHARKPLHAQPFTLLDVRVDEEVIRELDGDARKKRRRWRVWTGSLGLIVLAWSAFAAIRYLVHWLRGFSDYHEST